MTWWHEIPPPGYSPPYETMSGHGQIEYAAAGHVMAVDGRPIKSTPLSVDPRIAKMTAPALEGWACLYGTPIPRGDKVLMFEVGAFDETLVSKSRVDFELDHDDDLVVASTEDVLELHSDKKGLGFRLKLEDNGLADLVTSRKFNGVSVRFRDAEIREFNIKSVGLPIHLIKRAKLVEVSLVHRGAVRQAFARLVDTAKTGSLAVEMKGHEFGVESSYLNLMRVLEDYRESHD